MQAEFTGGSGSPPSSPSIDKQREGISIVPFVISGFISLTLLVIGIIAILSSLQGGWSGLGTIGQIGWQWGALFALAGVIGLTLSISIPSCGCCRIERVEQVVIPAKIFEPSSSTLLPSSSGKVTQSFIAPSLEEIMGELGFPGIDLSVQLTELYEGGWVAALPSSPRGSDEVELYKRLVKLLLISHQDFLAIKLQETNSWTSEERDYAEARMLHLEAHAFAFPPRSIGVGRELTLGDLRCLSPEEVTSLQIPAPALSLLSTAQLNGVFALKNSLTDAFLQSLLPIGSYTSWRFSKIDLQILLPYLQQLTLKHFRLLPPCCFALDGFPWQLITQSAENFRKLFSHQSSAWAAWQKETDWQFTQQVFAFLSVEKHIIPLAPLLDFLDLTLLPTATLQDAHFPWLEFIQREGIGEKLHLFSSELLLKTHLPWKEFANKPKEVDELLDLAMHRRGSELEYHNVFTENLLRGFELDVISTLAPHLRFEHLPCFKEDQLKNEHFPWLEFVQREGIGEKLHLFSSELLLKTHLPWKEFAKKPKEVDELLDLATHRRRSELEYRHVFTENLLIGFELDVISTLAPHLHFEHLRCFKEDQLKNEHFPWLEFVQREGIGEKLHLFSSELLLKTHLPWKEFANKPKEVYELLDLATYLRHREPEYHNVFTEKLLRGFELDVIIALEPHLRFEHLLCFGENQLKDEHFPWLEFVKSEGIGEKLHLFPAKVLLGIPIPWQQFANREQEIKSLFSLERRQGRHEPQMHPAFTYTLLSQLGFDVIEKVGAHLSLDHISFFGDRLQDPQFPWRCFINKQGIGKRLNQHVQSSFGLNLLKVFGSDFFPWAEIPTAELEELLSVSFYGDLNATQKILKALSSKTVQVLSAKGCLTSEHEKLRRAES